MVPAPHDLGKFPLLPLQTMTRRMGWQASEHAREKDKERAR